MGRVSGLSARALTLTAHGHSYPPRDAPLFSPPRTGGRAAPATYMRDGGIVRPNLHAIQTRSRCAYHTSFKGVHRLRRPRARSSTQHKLPPAHALPPQLDRDLLALSRRPRGPSRSPRGRPSMRCGRVATLDASACTHVPLALPSCRRLWRRVAHGQGTGSDMATSAVACARIRVS